MSRLAFFGGSFDPIHKGHEYIINEAYKRLKLDKLFILPNNMPPHKNYLSATYEQRCDMIDLVIRGDIRFELSYLESSAEKHYTVDTVKKIRDIYSKSKIYFIIGEDSLLDMDKWNKPIEILKFVDFAVFPRVDSRTNEDIDEICKISEKKFGGSIVPIEVKPYDISSTDIRKKLQMGESIQGCVSESVKGYILRNGLYIKK